MRPTVHGLTPARHRCLRAIVDYWDEHGFSPSSTDVSDVLDMSMRGSMYAIDSLAREGFITKAAGIPRSIVVTDAGRRALREYETGRVAVNGEAGRSER